MDNQHREFMDILLSLCKIGAECLKYGKYWKNIKFYFDQISDSLYLSEDDEYSLKSLEPNF